MQASAGIRVQTTYHGDSVELLVELVEVGAAVPGGGGGAHAVELHLAVEGLGETGSLLVAQVLPGLLGDVVEEADDLKPRTTPEPGSAP